MAKNPIIKLYEEHKIFFIISLAILLFILIYQQYGVERDINQLKELNSKFFNSNASELAQYENTIRGEFFIPRITDALPYIILFIIAWRVYLNINRKRHS